jgi:hypothetical protein
MTDESEDRGQGNQGGKNHPVQIPKDLWEQLRDQAEAQGLEPKDFVIQLLQNGVSQSAPAEQDRTT